MPTALAQCAAIFRRCAADRFDTAEVHEQAFRDFPKAAFYRDQGRELLSIAQRFERLG